MSTLPSDLPSPPEWWKSAIVYHIYPHSFLDSNGDGIGDINGIRAKLDYIRDLGATVIWICPLYRSPHVDMGYDVSDYYDIDPRYGTIEDWEKLLEEIHERDMKLVMDAVFNHSSNEHPWFVESKSSKVNPKRDWYIWRPPRFKNGIRRPPNNWASVMGGPAWEYVPEREEYYLHLFTVQQPDLNWENSAVRNAVVDVLTFWRNKGVDGFRFDAINAISKPAGLPDVEVSDHTQYYQPAHSLWINGPRVHEYLNEVYTKVVAGHGKMTVGETGFTFDPSVIAKYVLPKNEQLHQAFNMELMALDSAPEAPLNKLPIDYGEIQDVVEKWQTYGRDQGFWNTFDEQAHFGQQADELVRTFSAIHPVHFLPFVLAYNVPCMANAVTQSFVVFIENHDFGRSITRFGNDSTPELRALSAKMLATLQVTQTGTLYVYQGQEIGMKNLPRKQPIEDYKDVRTQLFWRVVERSRQDRAINCKSVWTDRAINGKSVFMDDILEDLHVLARDHARIPMQWDSTRNVGFTTGTPWMRAYEKDARAGWNVLDESKNPQSVWSFWKRALHTRKEHDVLVHGSFTRIHTCPRTFAYVRKLGNKTAWVALSLSPKNIKVSLKPNEWWPHGDGVHASVAPQLVLNNYDSQPNFTPGVSLSLRAYEALVFVK